MRCGHCNKTFDALGFLFDQWPSGKAHRPARVSKAGPPVLGRAQTAPSLVPAARIASEDVKASGDDPHRVVWALAATLLILLTIANTTWTFREPLIQNPRVNTWLKKAGGLEVQPEGLLKDPDQIQLVSRDMHSHPTRTGILVLSLTFVNLAPHSQVFPLLEITLLDGANQPVARRRFRPGEYLRTGADIKSGLAADVFLPILLELGDPGEQAVGFEIHFL